MEGMEKVGAMKGRDAEHQVERADQYKWIAICNWAVGCGGHGGQILGVQVSQTRHSTLAVSSQNFTSANRDISHCKASFLKLRCVAH